MLGFTTAYFHTPSELADELHAAGLRGVEVYGVEGRLRSFELARRWGCVREGYSQDPQSTHPLGIE